MCHVLLLFFFSSRRRHTRCALVTGFRRVLFRSERLCSRTSAISKAWRRREPPGESRNASGSREGRAPEGSHDQRPVQVRGRLGAAVFHAPLPVGGIARASCRESVCTYV